MQMGEIDGIRILDSATVDLMTTVQCPIPNYPSVLQGLVWFVLNNTLPFLGTRTYIGHRGSNYGCRTEMSYLFDSENQFGVTLLTNGESEEGKIIIRDQLAIFGFLSQRIYAQNIELSSHFMQPGVDTLIITTQFNNPDNHSFSANALITSIDSTIIDTVQMYDDGNHGDSQANDGLWGGYILPMFGENEFSVGVSTVDLDSGTHFILNDLVRFTTTGPVEFDGITAITDSIIEPGDYISFQFALKNLGSTGIAELVTAELSSNDTCFTSFVISGTFGNIEPGESKIIAGGAAFRVSEDCAGDVNLPITVSIYSDGYPFWTDSFMVYINESLGIETDTGIMPKEFALLQNYPNPFNPITTIQYEIPHRSVVQVTIYDLLGRKVKTLINQTQDAGYKLITWNATNDQGRPVSAGVYLYQIQAGEFVQTKKMVLLK